jgi:hypothetical protein
VVEGLAKGAPLTPERKKAGGELVHYGFGAAWGAVYGAASESFPVLCTPTGAALFGAKVWAVSHLLLLPMFGLEPPANRFGLSHHVYSLAGHAVYGLTAMAAYRALSSPVAKPILISSAAALYLLRMLPREVEEEELIIEEPLESYPIEPEVQPVL